MDDFLEKALKIIEEKIVLEKILVPPDVETVKLPFGLITIRCYNWKADGIRKISFMRLQSAFSFLNIAGMSIYPEPCYDVPIFNCDFNGMGKNIMPIINFVPLFNDPSYSDTYLRPMQAVCEKYSHFQRLQPSEFMKSHLAPHCTFAKVTKKHIDEALQCGIDYLTLYIELFGKAEKNSDTGFQENVKKAQAHYTISLLTNDPSRKMLGKIIGKKRADTIFNDVVV